ncbi:MAG: hypothetical protein WCQ96_04035 [Patescibacteria group bacterium]
MNEQNNLEPVQKPKSYIFVLTIIAISATALIVGSGVYVWQQSELQSTKAELQEKITSLQNQINQSTQNNTNQKTNNTRQESRENKQTDQEQEALSQSLPQTCVDEEGGSPVITSLSAYSGPVGTKLEIHGCNFSGFEGDKNAWIENSQGVKGVLYGESDSTSKLLKTTLASSLCQEDNSYTGWDCKQYLILSPGMYKIYTAPWDKESNKVEFTIK